MISIEQHMIEVEGFRTRYLTAGTGPTVVLLHAGGESSIDWQWTISLLSNTYRVYAPDLHGFGEESHPQAKYTTSFLKRFVSQFLIELGIKEAALVGNSMGGLIAMHVALTRPVNVTALVLVDSAALGREISPLVLGTAMPGIAELGVALCMTPPGAFQRAVLKIPLLFTSINRVPNEWLMEQCRLAQTPYFLMATLSALRSQLGPWGQREVLVDQLSNLQAPTLLIWGENDMILPSAQAYKAVEHLKNGHLDVMPGCGHMPHVEQPERFTATLKAFLDQHVKSNGESNI